LQVEASGDLGAELHEGTNSGGGGVENRDAVLLDDLPPPAGVWRVGCSLLDDLCGTVGKRPVHDVRLTGDPSDIRGTPVHVGLWMQIKGAAVREGGLREAPRGGVQDSLWSPGRCGSVQNEQTTLRRPPLRCVLR